MTAFIDRRLYLSIRTLDAVRVFGIGPAFGMLRNDGLPIADALHLVRCMMREREVYLARLPNGLEWRVRHRVRGSMYGCPPERTFARRHYGKEMVYGTRAISGCAPILSTV